MERKSGLKNSFQNASGDADGPERMNTGLDIQGSVYAQITSSKVRMRVDRIVNRRSGGRSGTLYLELWVTPGRPSSTINGYRVASSRLGELPGGNYYYNIDRTVSVVGRPPQGCYYWSVVLREYGMGYSDYVVLNTCLIYSKGSGACCGNSSAPACFVGVSTTGRTLSYQTQTLTVGTQIRKNWAPCDWYATSDVSWIRFANSSDDDGPAGESVRAFVTKNTSRATRTGYLSIYREDDDRLIRRVKIVQKAR